MRWSGEVLMMPRFLQIHPKILGSRKEHHSLDQPPRLPTYTETGHDKNQWSGVESSVHYQEIFSGLPLWPLVYNPRDRRISKNSELRFDSIYMTKPPVPSHRNGYDERF